MPEAKLRVAKGHRPEKHEGIVRAQPHRIRYVGFGLFEMAQRILRESAHPVKQRGIWIDSETRIGGADRLILAARKEQVIALRVIWQLAIGSEHDRPFGLTEYLCFIVGLGARPSQLFLVQMGYGVAGQRHDIVGVDFERLLEQSPGRIVVVFRQRLQLEHGIAAHREIDDVGVVGMRASCGLRLDELEAQSIVQSRHDLILQLEQVADVFLEAFGPEMGAGFRIDELRVDTHPVPIPLCRAFEDVPHAEFLADLLGVDGFALVSEGRGAGDHEAVADARKVGGKIVRDAVDEIILGGVAGEVFEGQHHDGKMRGLSRRVRRDQRAAVSGEEIPRAGRDQNEQGRDH